jgi:hypothetical protein
MNDLFDIIPYLKDIDHADYILYISAEYSSFSCCYLFHFFIHQVIDLFFCRLKFFCKIVQ